MKGLIVRKEFIDLILSGKKPYEVRKQPTKYRGRVALIWRGRAFGTVNIDDVKEISPEELFRMVTPEEAAFLKPYLAGKQRAYLWRLSDPVRFRRAIHVSVARGAQTWVRLKGEDIKRLVEEEDAARREG